MAALVVVLQLSGLLTLSDQATTLDLVLIDT